MSFTYIELSGYMDDVGKIAIVNSLAEACRTAVLKAKVTNVRGRENRSSVKVRWAAFPGDKQDTIILKFLDSPAFAKEFPGHPTSNAVTSGDNLIAFRFATGANTLEEAQLAMRSRTPSFWSTLLHEVAHIIDHGDGRFNPRPMFPNTNPHEKESIKNRLTGDDPSEFARYYADGAEQEARFAQLCYELRNFLSLHIVVGRSFATSGISFSTDRSSIDCAFSDRRHMIITFMSGHIVKSTAIHSILSPQYPRKAVRRMLVRLLAMYGLIIRAILSNIVRPMEERRLSRSVYPNQPVDAGEVKKWVEDGKAFISTYKTAVLP